MDHPTGEGPLCRASPRVGTRYQAKGLQEGTSLGSLQGPHGLLPVLYDLHPIPRRWWFEHFQFDLDQYCFRL